MKFFKGICFLALFAIASSEFTEECNQKCKDEKDGNDAVDSCQRGCRFFSIKYSAERSVFHPIFGSDTKDVLVKCTNDCNLSYKDADAENCADGCRWMKETSNQDAILDLGNGGISISFGMPDDMSQFFSRVNNMVNQQIQQQQERIHQIIGSKPEEREEKQHEPRQQSTIGGLFDSVHKQMKQMMQSLLQSNPETKEERDDDGKLLHGGGELVVVRSGPGYHEEKTYHLGPNADIEKILDSNMDDMINHKNPMEQFFNKDQVEVFEPNHQDVEIKPSKSFFDTDPWGIIKKIEQDVNGELEGPRLPETGLRSRHAAIPLENIEDNKLHRYIFIDSKNMCAGNRSEMKWSDWFSCLHVRMGVPNWLLVSSVALGVIFTLWLCLVIPTNAPKQKVRKTKSVDTKEMEANGLATIVVGDAKKPLDLPPSYDDVTKNELEPVHDFKAKVVLVDDDDIVEPLPEKVGLNQERNCSNV